MPRRHFSIAKALIAEGWDLTLDRVVSDHIAHVMDITDGNKCEAAKLLGRNRRTLQRIDTRKRKRRRR